MATVAQLVRMWGGLGSAAAAPIITSLPAGAVNEGETLSFDLTADQSVTWAIIGGADAAQFEISGSTLRWVSNGTKSYNDGGQNDYAVMVEATNPTTGRTDEITITITVDEVTNTAPILLSNHTGTIGRETPAGWAGQRLLRDAMWDGGDAPESWTLTQTSGTAGHFTEPTDGTFPAPTSAGVLAGLNGGPYVWGVVAHAAAGDSNEATFTYNTEAGTKTLATRAELAVALSSGYNGKTIALAEFATDLAAATNASRISLTRTRAAAGVTIKSENPDNRTVLGNITVRLPYELSFNDVIFTPSARAGLRTTEYAIYIQASQPAVGEEQSTIYFRRCLVRGPSSDPTTYVWAMNMQTGVHSTAGTLGHLSVYTEDFESEFIQNQFYYNQNTNANLVVEHTGHTVAINFSKATDRYDPGTSGTFSVHGEHRVAFNPRFDINEATVHADTQQLNNNESVADVAWQKMTVADGDGDSSALQAVFANPTCKFGITIHNLAALLRSVHLWTTGGSDAGHKPRLGYVTALTQYSGRYGSHGATWEDRPIGTDDPGVVLYASNTDDEFGEGFIQGGLDNASAQTLPAGLIFGNGDPDVSAYFPHADWITSDALAAQAFANRLVDNYTGLIDARFQGTWQEMLEEIETALESTIGAVRAGRERPIYEFAA